MFRDRSLLSITLVASLIAVTSALFTLPVQAASQKDRDACNGNSTIDAAITACFRIVYDQSEDAESRASAYFNLGYLYDRMSNSEVGEDSDTEQAIAYYSEAIQLNPKLTDAYYRRGQLYSGKGDYDRAIADYNEAILSNSNFARAYYYRGLIYARKKGDLDRAIADYSEAIKLDPNFSGPYSDRASIYADKGDLDRAIADYSEAIKLNPRYASGAYYGRALMYASKGDRNHAIADFRKAAELGHSKADEKLREFGTAR